MMSKLLLSKLFHYSILLLSLSACSRFIEGDVFLDKNGNNLRDAGESVVAGMPFTVMKDNAVFKTGVTDSLGHFSVVLGNSANDGNYCVQVDKEDVAAVKSKDLSAGKALQSESDTPEPTADVCPLNGLGRPDCSNEKCCDNAVCAQAQICKDNNDDDKDECSKDKDGEPDCTDSDCCDESECKDDSACKKEEDKNACPKDKDGAPNCDDSRCEDEPECKTYTVKSGQTCDKIKSTAMVLALDVPVAMDYETRVAKVEKRVSSPAERGDKVGIEITFPSSCTFDPYVLPAAVVPQGLGEAYNVTTRELFLAKAIANIPSQLITRDTAPFGHDALYTYVMSLQVEGDDSLKDSEVTIQPTLTCPDGKKVSASANVISLKASQTYTVAAEISPKCPQVGESATISAKLEAKAEQGFSDAVFTLAIGGESHISLGSIPSFCKNKGESLECDLSSGASGSKAELDFQFTLEEDSSTVSFSPRLDVAGSQFTDTAIICSL